MLGPYLKGGGAKSLDFQSLSQDLIRTSMQIPFSVPPYMSLLARSTATLEGIALMGDPNYQMVSQVCVCVRVCTCVRTCMCVCVFRGGSRHLLPIAQWTVNVLS